MVHVNHGVGVYQGMETLEIGGIHQDYMSIHYQDGGNLFVPVSQIKLVQKYVSSDAKVPKLNKLGGTEWAKTKRKVTAKIEDIADELIELYAKRDAEKDMRLAEIQWNNKNSNRPSHTRKRKTNCAVLRKLRKTCKRTNRWIVFLSGTLDTGKRK